jgi:hypothetical protein
MRLVPRPPAQDREIRCRAASSAWLPGKHSEWTINLNPRGRIRNQIESNSWDMYQLEAKTRSLFQALEGIVSWRSQSGQTLTIGLRSKCSGVT